MSSPNNQLLSDGEFNYEFDDEGNQVRRTNIANGEVTEFEYDHRNRLTKTTVKSSGGVITSESQYIFDVFGRRIAIINSAVRSNIVYDGDNAWADYNEAHEAITRYLFGDSIDSNIARWRLGEGTAWYIMDHLGTVRAVADATGLFVNQTKYDSFGQVLTETNSLFGDRFKFTGRELNLGSDYYYRARTYNASQGRFGSLDPIRFGGRDPNLYRYVANSSLTATDPTGNLLLEDYAFIAFIAFDLVYLGLDCADLLPPPWSEFPSPCNALLLAVGLWNGAPLQELIVALELQPPDREN